VFLDIDAARWTVEGKKPSPNCPVRPSLCANYGGKHQLIGGEIYNDETQNCRRRGEKTWSENFCELWNENRSKDAMSTTSSKSEMRATHHVVSGIARVVRRARGELREGDHKQVRPITMFQSQEKGSRDN